MYHLNAHSLFNKYEDFTLVLSEFSFKFNIIMITKMWHNALNLPDLDGYIHYSLNRTDRRGGGIAIYVLNADTYATVNKFTELTPDYETLSLCSGDTTFTIS